MNCWRKKRGKERFLLGAKPNFSNKIQNWLVDEEGWRVGAGGLQVLHRVPLVDAALVGADAALVVRGPDQGHPTWEVVVPPSHLTGFVQDL